LDGTVVDRNNYEKLKIGPPTPENIVEINLNIFSK